MKGKKIIVPVLLASLVAAPAVAGVNAVTSTVKASGTTPLEIAGPDAKITGYKAEVTKGGDITVPSITGGTETNVSVTTPFGSSTVTKTDGTKVNVNEITQGLVFKAEETGYYTFTYEAKNTNSISSVYEQLTVFVKGDSYSMNMVENTYFVIPSNIAFATGGTTVKFPVPETYKNNEKEATAAGTVQLVVTKPDGTEATPVTEVKTDTATGEKYLEYTFGAEGRYRYKYKYVVGGSVVATTNSKTVKLISGYNTDDIELDFSLAGTMPTSAEIGKEVTLPEINVFDKNNSSKYVDAYTKITVKYTGNEDVTDAERTQVVTDYKFTPKYAGTYVISYEAIVPLWNNKTTGVRTYRIKDVRDIVAPSFYLTDSYTVENDGTVKVGGTDITNKELDEQLELLGDRSYWLDAYYEADASGKVTVAIPAAYFVDSSSSINEVIANSTRELYKKGSSSNTLTLVNSIAGTTQAKINEVAYYTFSNDTSAADDDNYYVVKYFVADALGNKSTYTYNLYIRTAGANLPNEGPQITLDPALTGASVVNGNTLTFSKPVVVDKHDGKVYDSVVETKTYYSYTSATADLVELTNADVNEDGEYEIDINGGNKETLYIVTKAKNRYFSESTNEGYTVKSVAVEIKYPENDTVAPNLNSMLLADFNTKLLEVNKESGSLTAENVKDLADKLEMAGLVTNYNNDTFANILNVYGRIERNSSEGVLNDNEVYSLFNQNAVITVPEMTFYDNDNSLNLSVVVTYKANENAKSKTVKLSNYTVSSDANQLGTEGDNNLYSHTISNASFTASNAGYYYVTYVAVDGGNNTSFKTYAVYVNDTVGPRIEVPNASKFNNSIRPGQWFDIPSAVAYDNDVESSGKITTSVSGPNGAYELSSDNKSFRPLKTGTYYVTYKAYDSFGNPSQSVPYAVEVKAALDEEKFYIEFATQDYEDDFENVEYQTNSSLIVPIDIKIPKATAVDLDMKTSVNVAKPTVTIIGITKEVSEVDNLYYTFRATSQGEHIVKYSATSEFGISISKEIVIKVGDTQDPTLTWVNKAQDLPTTVEVGSAWEFDFDFVSISDEGSDDTIENKGITYTITMYDPDGTKVEVSDYKYTFDKVGSYKFEIKLTDKAGNSTGQDYRYTITVEEKEETTNPISNTTGTILIVTSVVVLGGVVIYFVVSGRKMSAESKKNNSKKGKNSKKEDK